MSGDGADAAGEGLTDGFPVSRRALLKSGAAAGATAGGGGLAYSYLSGEGGGGGTRVDGAVSGRVVDVEGNGVPAATVVAYAARSTDSSGDRTEATGGVEVVGEACTGPDGVFAFDFGDLEPLRERYGTLTDQTPKQVAVVATRGGAGGGDWFGTDQFTTGAFFDGTARNTVLLNKEVLFEGTVAPGGTPAGDVTVWREVHTDSTGGNCPSRRSGDGQRPRLPEQTLGVEVAGHRGNLDTSYDDTRHVGSGSLSLQVPETACCVRYPDGGGFRPLWSPPSGPEDPAGGLVAEEFGIRLQETGSPVPVLSTAREIAFEAYTEADRTDVIEQYEAKGNFVSVGLTLLSFSSGLLGSAASGLSIVGSLQGSGGTSPPDPGDPAFLGEGSTHDPNRHDLVSTGWLSSATPSQWPYAVAHEVPVQFTGGGGDSTVTVSARGLWGTSAGQGQARLDRAISFDPGKLTPAASTTGFSDDFELDDSLSGFEQWEVVRAEGDFRWEWVERPSPDGGTRCLGISETTGGGTVGGVGWSTGRGGWRCPWTARGLFYTADVPLDRAYQTHDLRLATLNVELGFVDESGSSVPFALTGSAVEEVTERYDVTWAADTWYWYEVSHEGGGEYTGRLWTDGEDRPAEPDALSTGTRPPRGANTAALSINGAYGAPFRMDHAFVEWGPQSPQQG